MKLSAKTYLNYYKIDATFYSIEVYLAQLTESEFKTLFEKYRYYCRKNHCSCMVVFSDTDSKTAVQTIEHTGKVGRPKKRITGKKIAGHIHSIVVGNHSFSTAQQIKQSIDKRYGKKVASIKSKGDGIWGYNYIRYCLNQCNQYRTCGEFDFKAYVNQHDDFVNLK